MKKSLLPACIGALATVIVSAPALAQSLKDVKITVPRNSVLILSAFGGKDAGIFRKHGINLIIDARPFRGHMAGLPSKEVPVARAKRGPNSNA